MVLQRDINSLLDSFVSYQLYEKYDIGAYQDKAVEKFIEEAKTHFSSCDFIIEALGITENNLSEL